MSSKRSQRLAFCVFVVVALCVIGRNYYTRYRNAQLFAAIAAQDVDRARSLLNRGADVNATQGATPALLYAMNQLQSPTSDLDPAVNTPGQPEAIPPRQNVSSEAEAMACLLIERHADMRMPSVVVERNGRESVSSYDDAGYIRVACRHGSIPVLRCVLNRGAVPTPQCLEEAFDYFSLYSRLITSRSFGAPPAVNSPAKIEEPTRGRQAKQQEISRQMVQMLREHGLRPTLEQCVKLNDVAALKAELEAGAPPDPQKAGSESPLELAATANSTEMVTLLLAHGANPNLGTSDTVLNDAVRQGNLEMVKLLLAKGADVNGGRGETALETAVWSKRLAIARLLMARGADPNFTPRGAASASLLTGAITFLPEIVPELLKRGVNAREGNGAALIAALRSRRIALAGELLRRGVNVNPLPVRPTGAAGGSLASPGAMEAERKISYAPDPKHPGRNIPQPFSPLLNAVLYAPEVEAMLRKAGANIGPDKTAILSALAKCGRADLFARMVELGADVNAVDEDGETALTQAVKTAPSGVAVLLAHGANPNVITRSQRTPLDMAAGAGNVEIARLLLAHGAKVNLRPPRGHTALYWAQKHKHPELVALLEQAGAKPE